MTTTIETGTTAAGAVDAVKKYGSGDSEVFALAGVSVSFERGHFSAIMGPLIFGGVVWLALRVLPEGTAAARSARASGLGVLMLLSFIIISYVILQKVTDTKRVWTGADLGDSGAATAIRH